MKILDYKWFNGRTLVGIVCVKDDYDGIKYYIGAPKGVNEQDDVAFIADWGSTFPKNVGDVLFNRQQSVQLSQYDENVIMNVSLG